MFRKPHLQQRTSRLYVRYHVYPLSSDIITHDKISSQTFLPFICMLRSCPLLDYITLQAIKACVRYQLVLLVQYMYLELKEEVPVKYYVGSIKSTCSLTPRLLHRGTRAWE